MSKDARPVNLDPRTISLPITAVVSILHRVSGIGLFLFLPLLLCALNCSLKSADSFAKLQAFLQTVGGKGILFLFIVTITYHIVSGIRHLIMDMGFLESVTAMRATAFTVFGLSGVIIIALTGVWVW